MGSKDKRKTTRVTGQEKTRLNMNQSREWDSKKTTNNATWYEHAYRKLHAYDTFDRRCRTAGTHRPSSSPRIRISARARWSSQPHHLHAHRIKMPNSRIK